MPACMLKSKSVFDIAHQVGRALLSELGLVISLNMLRGGAITELAVEETGIA